MNLKFFVLIPNLLFPAVLLLMGSVFYQIRTLKSELGCQSLLHFPSGVLTPTAHFCGFAFCFLLKRNALLLLQISFWRKKKTNKWIWVRTWAYTSARRQAAQYPRVCCSFLGGAPMQPCPRGTMDIPSPADSVNSHTSLLTRQNAKAIWCPHFYSQFCYKFAHFSEDGLFLFPEHSITVTSGTENHFDKCPIYREMNSHKGDQFFFLFFFLSFIGEGNSWINFIFP